MRPNRTLLGTLILSCLPRQALCAPPVPVPDAAAAAALLTPLLNLSYLPSSSVSKDDSQKLDLYLPARTKPAVPLFVYFHGGAWQSGDKNQYAPLGLFLAEQGVAAAIVNYRLSGNGANDIRHPAHAQDAAAAVAWLRKHAPQYGYDANRVFVGGHSSGAHLSALLAYDRSLLAAVGEKPEALRGFVGLDGIYDLNALWRRFPSYGTEYLFPAFGTDEETWRAASPQQLIGPAHSIHRRPWLLIHSREDELVDTEQSERFQKALEKHGVAVRGVTLMQGSHFRVVKELSSPTSLLGQQLLAFLRS